ncbi:MAG TPA: sigma-70 family RNA polymerase sigma factor, partial [Planctomycetota bacterium]|nr:sigma-70 family RNA polymerase sigma factor [Planctomycetota bacterium]
LVRRAGEGDRAAFEELVRRTSRMVYARLYLDTGDAHAAEDLVQETYLRAFRSMHQLTDPRGFRAWLTTIGQSALIDAARRAGAIRRSPPPRAPQEALEGAPAPEGEEAGRAETRDKVRTILQSLPEEYRLPLTLRYIDGADYESIQMQLGLSPGSLRGLLYRGLQLLRRAVKQEVPHESR